MIISGRSILKAEEVFVACDQQIDLRHNCSMWHRAVVFVANLHQWFADAGRGLNHCISVVFEELGDICLGAGEFLG